MTCHQIVPGLVVTTAMYDGVNAVLGQIAPEHRLTWEQFVDPARWCLVPDPDAVAYKAEYVLLRTIVRTLKINVWFGPDLRVHSHPWIEFTSHVIAGAITEDRHVLQPDGRIHSTVLTHEAGEDYTLPGEEYHQVTTVLDPGRTVTLMDCGPWEPDSWDNLDPATGVRTPNVPDPGFRQRLQRLNPHLEFSEPAGV